MSLMAMLLLWGTDMDGDSLKTASSGKPTREEMAGVPPEIHGAIGDSSAGWEDRLRIVNIGKRQQHDWHDRVTLDTDIFSPKSVSFHPDGERCYVNSLEGCKTVVYALPDLIKVAVIEHNFPSPTGRLWAQPSGYYPFSHYPDGASRPFRGKPVEGAFSHSGRYFWVPYYRRTFDINAQDPSAVAVIDTSGDSIIRMFETGPLPKMIAYSPVANRIAITHWGDNTVGLIDVSSAEPEDWHHLPPIEAGRKLTLDFPLDKTVDRDANSGHKLRGTVFTPDGRYLLVSAMGGPMHVFDIHRHRYIGSLSSAYGIRHIIIKNGHLYGSRNIAATVLSIPLDSLTTGIANAVEAGKTTIEVRGWRTCKVGGGARTLDATPDGELLFVACNSASVIYAVDAETLTVVDRIRVDSYPVGLDVSDDGRLMAVTSQGRKGFGGNALNLFSIIRPEQTEPATITSENIQEEDSITAPSPVGGCDDAGTPDIFRSYMTPPVVVSLTVLIVTIVVIMVIIIAQQKRQNKNKNN